MPCEMEKCPLLISNIRLTSDNSDIGLLFKEVKDKKYTIKEKKHIVFVIRITKKVFTTS